MDQVGIDHAQQVWLVAQCRGRSLQIGSGMKPIPGAVNLDPNPDRRRWAEVAGFGDRLPFADGVFDTVVSSHVLPVFGDIVGALHEMARVLRPGGMMAHVVPDLRYAPSRASSHWRFERQYAGWHGPDDFRQSIGNGLPELDIVELENFSEFQWSFKFVARKTGN